MNRKFALLMFAIGLGAASAPALAVSCERLCLFERETCIAQTSDSTSCQLAYWACVDNCAVQP